MHDIWDVVIIGGGASGMMAAATAAARNLRVVILERNGELGKKLKITGGGRCNVTNAEEDVHRLLPHYGAAENFLYSPFAQFGVAETFAYFSERRLPLVIEGLKRAFPCTHKAADVFAVLERELTQCGVHVRCHVRVSGFIKEEGRVTGVQTESGVVRGRVFVLATGGTSHPETGSTGDGFQFLSHLGVPIVSPSQALVPLAVRDEWVKRLSGVTLADARVTFFVDGARRSAIRGRVLFTHFGLSGPTILNAAAQVSDYLHEGSVTAHIDLLPLKDHGTIDQELIEFFERNKNKTIKNCFQAFAPPGMGLTLLSHAQVDPETKVHSVKKEMRKQIVQRMKSLPLTITGLMGEDMAIVSDGGVPLTEIDLKTMALKAYPNIRVTGDLLHIRRPSGGYSLQLCWTTGYIAGSTCSSSL